MEVIEWIRRAQVGRDVWMLPEGGCSGKVLAGEGAKKVVLPQGSHSVTCSLGPRGKS